MRVELLYCYFFCELHSVRREFVPVPPHPQSYNPPTSMGITGTSLLQWGWAGQLAHVEVLIEFRGKLHL